VRLSATDRELRFEVTGDTHGSDAGAGPPGADL
jgi:hypothetical protein